MGLLDKIGGKVLGSADALGRLLGPERHMSLGRNLGSLACYFTPRELQVLEAQLKFAAVSAPSLASLDAKTVLKKMYGHIGESVAELSHFKYFLEKDPSSTQKFYPKYKRIESLTRDQCREVIERNEGALVLGGHIGNFELLAAYHIASGLKVTILGREPNYNFISNWIQRIRTDYGSESLLRGSEGENKRGAVLASIKALKTGKVLAALPDQDTALGSEFAPFFNLSAAHVVAPLKLALGTNKKVFTSFIVRVGPLQHRVYSEQVEYDPKSENPERDILIEYSKRLQALVIEFPEQYLWIHRRWRRRPGVDYEKNPSELRGKVDYLNWLAGNPRGDAK